MRRGRREKYLKCSERGVGGVDGDDDGSVRVLGMSAPIERESINITILGKRKRLYVDETIGTMATKRECRGDRNPSGRKDETLNDIDDGKNQQHVFNGDFGGEKEDVVGEIEPPVEPMASVNENQYSSGMS